MYMFKDEMLPQFLTEAAPERFHLTIDQSPGVNGVWVDPVPGMVVGEVKKWADAAKIDAVRIPGYWMAREGEIYPEDWKPLNKDKVLYYMHGGGYVAMSARPSDPNSSYPKKLLKLCPDIKRSFSIEYRLSTGPPWQAANPFPAALIDALAGYNYLVNVKGYSPSNIIMAGNSAGGHLTLSLVRYLVKNPISSLPVPCAMFLSSPGPDMGGHLGENVDPKSSWVTCQTTDFISPRNFNTWDAYEIVAFLGPIGSAASTNEYICPASVFLPSISFEGFPKSFVLAGGAEIFRDAIRILKDRMTADLGTEMVTYHEGEDTTHDYVVFPWFEPQSSIAWAAVTEWVATL